MICLSYYKDRPAYTVETDMLAAVILPEDGAKIASLRRKADGKELLATKPGDTYKPLTSTGSYVDSECSGFDDMFPTVDPDSPVGNTYGTYPDHGECCRLAYRAAVREDSLVLSARSCVFPVTYEKVVRAEASGAISMSYQIQNRSDAPFPFLWAGHIMLAGEDGMKVLTPFGDQTPTEMMFAEPVPASASQLPYDRLMQHKPGIGATYKFYYLEPMPEGVFGVRYPDGSKLTFTVDPQKLPYLGVWLNNGAFQDGYSITPEPCSVPFDAPSRAAQRGYHSLIPASDAITFTIQIQLTGGTA